MSSTLKWKFLLIVAVVLVTAWPWASTWLAGNSTWYAETFEVDPARPVLNLGLDLQGGVHILLQVDTDSALEYERDLTQSRVGNLLKDEGVPYTAIAKENLSTFSITGTPADREAETRAVLVEFLGSWELSRTGPGAYTVTMPPAFRGVVHEQAAEGTLSTLRRRVDSLGVREPLIQKQGLQGDRILVQLPGVEDITQVQNILGTSALLEWKEMTYPPGAPNSWRPGVNDREGTLALFGGSLPADTQFYDQRIENLDGTTAGTISWPLKTVSTVIGDDLKMASRSADEWGNPNVAFELSQDAARRFRTATRANIDRVMAITLDGEVISAPRIESEIFDRGQITGNFSIEEADRLSLQLRSGALPVEVDIIEERTVGPSLGRDSIQAGLMAVAIGFGGVLLFMLIYYRLAGVNALVALALNVLLILGAMAYAGATLTLPGIAGLVLVIGMAVDSNVLIFERVREELRLGKTVRSAVDQGFGRAILTIVDCNITTLVAAFFLFSYGTGPVRGFAVTLFIGLLASMFTAVFVSRQLFEVVLTRRRKAAETLSI
jgi:preprotein translocase subunit SecD